MLNFSPEKLLLVGIIALIVLGPDRLPQAARTLGRVLAEVRRVSGSFQSEMRGALTEPREALTNAVGELGLNDLHSSVRNAVTGAVNPAAPTPSAASTTSGPSVPTSGPSVPPSPSAASTTSAPATAGPPPVPDDPSLN